MDPITAVQVNIAVDQLATTAFHTCDRIESHAKRDTEIPSSLKDIKNVLKLLQSCLVDIQFRLSHQPEDYSNNSLTALNDFLARLQESCMLLNGLLHFSAEQDSSTKPISTALHSAAEDEGINKFATAFMDDVVFLTLDQSAPTFKIASGDVPHTTEPPDGQMVDNVPQHLSPYLIPRAEIISQVESSFATSESLPQVIVLQGMGGQGKTQLALEYCRQAIQKLQYAGIFWIDASNLITTTKCFDTTCHAIYPNKYFPDAKARMLYVKDSLRRWKRPWLIVFDGYDTTGVLNLADFAPNSSNGRVIVTTRNQDLSRFVPLISVPELDEEQSLNLFYLSSQLIRSEESEKHVKAIVKCLGHMPMAIGQAGSYMGRQQTTMDISHFLPHYEIYSRSVLSRTPDTWKYLDLLESDEQKNNAKNIFITWNLSRQSLNPASIEGYYKVEIISLFAFFDINDISEEFFRTYHNVLLESRGCSPWMALFEDRNKSWSHEQFADTMLAFQELSLVSKVEKRDDGCIHISLSPLVRDWILLPLSESSWKSYFSVTSDILAYSLLHYRHGHDYAYQWGYRLTQIARNAYLAHVTIWHTNFKKWHPIHPVILKQTKSKMPMSAESIFADFFQDCSIFENASAVYEWLWEHCNIADSRSMRLKSRARNCYIDTLYLQDRTDGILRLAKESLRYWNKEKVNDDILLDSRYFLAMAYRTEASVESNHKAECLVRDLLVKLEESGRLGKVDNRYGLFLIELACTLAAQDQEPKQNEASDIVQRLVESSDQEGGWDFRHSCWTCYHWQIVIILHPEIHVSEKIAREYLQSTTQIYGENSPSYLHSLGLLANTLGKKHEYKEATEHYNRCIFLLDQAPRRSQTFTDCYEGLALMTFTQGIYTETIQSLTKLAVYRSRLPSPGIIEIGQTLATCCKCHEALGQYETMNDSANHCILLAETISATESLKGELLAAALYHSANAKFALWKKNGEVSLLQNALLHLKYLQKLNERDFSIEQATNCKRDEITIEDPDTFSDSWLRLLDSRTIRGDSQYIKFLRSKINDECYAFEVKVNQSKCLAYAGDIVGANKHLDEAVRAFAELKKCSPTTVKKFIEATLDTLHGISKHKSDLELFENGIRWAWEEAEKWLGDPMEIRDWITNLLRDRASLLAKEPYESDSSGNDDSKSSELLEPEKKDPNLCQKCQNILDCWYLRLGIDGQEGLFPMTNEPYHSILDLVKSSSRGCPICALFLASLNEKDVNQLKEIRAENISRLVFDTPSNDKQSCTLFIDFDARDKRYNELPMAETFVVAAERSDTSDELSAVAVTTDCNQTWVRAKTWLGRCTGDKQSQRVNETSSTSSASSLTSSVTSSSNIASIGESDEASCDTWHHYCCNSIMKKVLPTRLIDVGLRDSDLRLCLTEGLLPDIRYLTLSHCWGKFPINIVTTRDNIAAMLEHICYNDLTKTFQDAIVITRRLGFRYLWIDSLCILQKDETDWLKEASIMGEIYAASYLNIVASDASDGKTGCFFDRDLKKVRGYKARVCATAHTTGKRGWCFQETFLSPRSLYLSKDQLFWQCRSLMASETLPLGLDLSTSYTRATIQNWKHKYLTNHMSEWFQIVNDYSSRLLSFGKDKLIAISGVAKLYNQEYSMMYKENRSASEQFYMAGLWRQKLEQQIV
ncbi:hypothetical protein BP6252_13062 [Coleophoma cylindrospora]|uniref:Heterokaryon incompatibility domain-containing protein n=1 Tax=Coleophoma cylindrospora TaxID=1849047 RepID=A0A3D8Q9T3_9HELO|nr:hypothetical protein BP6252_13062 [Coleophoma cylindrospora]